MEKTASIVKNNMEQKKQFSNIFRLKNQLNSLQESSLYSEFDQ